MKKGLFLLLFLFTVLIGCSDNQKQDKSVKEGVLDMGQFAGYWSGEIEVPNQPLSIHVNVEKSDNVFNGTIGIPVQGIEKYPLSTVKVEENSITFSLEIQGQYIIFDGELDGKEIAGTFKQNGQTFPFSIIKREKVANNHEEDKDGEFLQVETKQGTLYGELEIPAGEGPFPVMIIIPGSGATDRNGNGNTGTNNSLKFLAEELADNGIASLRYDKRGAGKNSRALESEEDIDFNLFISDATAWIDRLKKEKRFIEIGIIGHSQGSLVGMLAAHKAEVDIFLSISGPGRTIDQVLYDQLKEQLPKDLLKESKEIIAQLKSSEKVDHVNKELQGLFRPSVQPLLSSWMQYDPAEEIEKLNVPTLIVNGENDLQVSDSEAELLYQANKDAEILLIEKMNHVLKEAPKDRKGNMATYFDPELPLADGLIDGIMRFLKEKGFIH